MAYYLDISSPETYEVFSKTDKTIVGFSSRFERQAHKVRTGDRLVCYMTKISRWVGVLEVISESFKDTTPRYYEESDPYVIRFHVKPLIWLEKDKAVPIKEDGVWNTLSITKGYPKGGSQWTGRFRSSLNKLDEDDGKFLESLLQKQVEDGKLYPIDEAEYKKYTTERVRSSAKVVSVTIPEDTEEEKVETKDETEVRQSIKVQALLARIGEKMGFTIWLPRMDRSQVLKEWTPDPGSLIETLPVNYDEATNRTVEQIDVLWLNRRFIVRAFEVEHTTSIYSGILRMADLLALQPNLDIKLHIVAPSDRREKVFAEIRRPVFSLFERRPLSEACTYLSYDSLNDLAKEKHLSSMKDNVLEDYEETAE